MKIRLEDPDPAWAAHFRDLRARLAEELRETALAIEHVGSTAVPGLCAKPVVDVLLVVPDATDEAAYFGPVERCGFEFRLREPDWYEHRLFRLERPAANLHVFSEGCPETARMLFFRDLLRENARARETYAVEKRRLARKEWSEVQAYAEAKTEVVEDLLDAGGWSPSSPGRTVGA